MSSITQQRGKRSTLVVVVKKPNGEWYAERNPKEKDIPEGERFDLYDVHGARLVLPKGAINMAKQLIKDRQRHANR